MSSRIGRCLVISAALAMGVIVVGPAGAQHHGGHHGGHHGWSHHGGHHSSWRHVVPSHHHHMGLYYSYGGVNYYTPVAPPVEMRVLQPQINVRSGITLSPAVPVEPIAPRSVKLEFGGFQQTEDLSGRLEKETNRWCLDMHYNYRHNPEFTATYREAYQILAAARYIHSAEHREDREAIRKQAAAVEPLFHHVQEKIQTWTREERRVVGQSDINSKTAAVESILHHLLYDVGVEQQHGETAEEQAPPPSEDAPPPSSE